MKGVLEDYWLATYSKGGVYAVGSKGRGDMKRGRKEPEIGNGKPHKKDTVRVCATWSAGGV